MKKDKVAILIPLYKPALNEFETLSLKQCLKILPGFPLIFVTPENFDITTYAQICDGHTFITEPFEEKYFGSIADYNSLLLTPKFYKRFLKYEFILIHQLDVFVFKNELLAWCERSYDYIGAPFRPAQNQSGEMQVLKRYGKFLKLFTNLTGSKHQISNVGNGGFSLRKTRTMYWLVKLLNKQLKKWGTYNEDAFFMYWGNILYPFFKLPTDAMALKFSIEVAPRESLQKLNNILPFGCHAFEKYDFDFWKPYILNNQQKS